MAARIDQTHIPLTFEHEQKSLAIRSACHVCRLFQTSNHGLKREMRAFEPARMEACSHVWRQIRNEEPQEGHGGNHASAKDKRLVPPHTWMVEPTLRRRAQ